MTVDILIDTVDSIVGCQPGAVGFDASNMSATMTGVEVSYLRILAGHSRPRIRKYLGEQEGAGRVY